MQMGPYLHPVSPGVWRVASEDSDQFVPWFLPVHGANNLRNGGQTFPGQMLTGTHRLDAAGEPVERQNQGPIRS